MAVKTESRDRENARPMNELQNLSHDEVVFLKWTDKRGGVNRCFCLTSVCLSVAYTGPKSRTERPRKTKIGTQIAHVTRDLETTFKVKRSKVKVTRPLYSARP